MNIDNSEKIECGPDFHIRKKFVGFVSLLGSGVISAIGFMLIASQRWSLFDQHLAAFIILFVQWQTLGLTISKVGIENVVFAVVSSDRNKCFDSWQFILRKVLPLAGLYSVVVWFIFSPLAALVSFGSILLDASSLIIMADLNARGYYRITSISNLLNYPIFFLILVYLHYLDKLNLNFALGTFLFSSLLRWLWLAKTRVIPANREEVICTASLEMGMQQVLNYLLFRNDQLIISFFLLSTLATKKIGTYVYMAKFPEIVASVMVVAGTVYFPSMYIQYPVNWARVFSQIKKYRLYVLAYCLLMAGVVLMYRRFWSGVSFPLLVLLPFLIQALMVIIINNVTYSMLRQGYISGLLRNLIVSIIAGLLYFAMVLGTGMDIYALAWLVPIQFLIFLMLSFFSKCGKKVTLYA